jgi:hypothetical protein
MRKRISWLAALVVIGIAVSRESNRAQAGDDDPLHEQLFGWLTPSPVEEALVRGQMGDVPPPSTILPLPFGRPRLDQGGFYVASEFTYYLMTNPLKSQPLAFRGIQDMNDTIHAAIGLGPTPGNFIGTKSEALDVNSVSGPNSYTPGFTLTLGYRWQDGFAAEVKWLHLFETKNSATAGLLPPGQAGAALEETFLTSPVFNFPPAYAGPGNQTGQGSGTAILGIWDGSSLQTITFIQRFDQVEINFRIPIQESECWRTYGIVGPREQILYERFTWRVVSQEGNGNVAPNDTATYTNTTANDMYGVKAGVGNEWFLGDSPAGGFSLSVDLTASMMLDFVKGRPKYELGDRSTATGHARNWLNFVPEGDANINLWWYPYEGIIVRLGYDALAMFNTMGSSRPVDFNFGSITPEYSSTFRYFGGVNFGVGFIF